VPPAPPQKNAEAKGAWSAGCSVQWSVHRAHGCACACAPEHVFVSVLVSVDGICKRRAFQASRSACVHARMVAWPSSATSTSCSACMCAPPPLCWPAIRAPHVGVCAFMLSARTHVQGACTSPCCRAPSPALPRPLPAPVGHLGQDPGCSRHVPDSAPRASADYGMQQASVPGSHSSHHHQSRHQSHLVDEGGKVRGAEEEGGIDGGGPDSIEVACLFCAFSGARLPK